MNARIAAFQLLWDAIVLPPVPPPTPLVRCDNRHHLLPEAELDRFWTATAAERAEMMRLNEIRLEAARERRAAGIYTQEELDNIASWNPLENNGAGDAERVPAPLAAPTLPENNLGGAIPYWLRAVQPLAEDEEALDYHDYLALINDEDDEDEDDPLDYHDEDADDPYDLELAAY
jgi:hypothetical protein